MGRGRAPCCDKSQVKRGPWSPAEDLRLTTFIQQHGHENWRSLPKQAGLLRCGKSCRLRWINYLRPDVKRGNFTSKEEETIIQLHESLGNKWSKIAAQLPGRTDNEIKNVWNTHLKKKLAPKKSTITSPTSSSSGSYTSCDNNKNVGMELGEDQTSQDFKPSEVLSLDENLDFETLLSNSSHSYNSEITNFSPVDPSAPDQDELMGPLLDFCTTEMNHEQEIFPSAEAFEIPLETDSDFWNMLDDSAGAFIQSNEAQWREEVDLGHTDQENNSSEAERWKWLRYLENELGLEASRDENKEQETNGAAEPSHDTVLKQEIDQVMDYFQIRSSSPQNIEM